MSDEYRLKELHPEHSIEKLRWGISLVGGSMLDDYLAIGGRLDELETAIKVCQVAGVSFERMLAYLWPYHPAKAELIDIEKAIKSLTPKERPKSGQEKRRERRKMNRL